MKSPTKAQMEAGSKSWDELSELGRKLKANGKHRKTPLTYEEMSALHVYMQDQLGEDIIKAFESPNKQFAESFEQSMSEAEERRTKEKAVNSKELGYDPEESK